MGCQQLEDAGELILLGVATGEDLTALRQHIEQGCPRCVARMREAALTVLMLIQPVHPVRLNPTIKSRLLRRVRKK